VPLTIAHPIAAIPLRRPLGRMGVLSALVIGSLTPDLPLYLPLSPSRVTHSALALLWFCLPAGIVGYLLFDRVLDRPLRALLPDGVRSRLASTNERARPPAWSPAVLISLLIGAVTHSLWDTFTHGASAGTRLFPALETRLFTASGYTAYVFSVLQHASSILGTLVLVGLMVRWYGTAPRSVPAAPDLTPRLRRWLLAAIAAVVLAAVVTGGASRFPDEPTVRALQPFVRRLIVTALSSLFAAVTVYAVVWHWMQARPRT
jgi:hypothetical protein